MSLALTEEEEGISCKNNQYKKKIWWWKID